jgi:hypothetical protein
VEVILALMAFKVLYPQHMHLARGNHESQGMNKLYGFDGEVSAAISWTFPFPMPHPCYMGGLPACCASCPRAVCV